MSPSPAIRPALEGAIIALRDGRLAEAEQLAARALAAEPADRLAAQALGQARLLQDRPAEAIAPLQAAALRHQDPETETLLARALAAAGRADEALVVLRLATTRRPPFPLAFLDLGERLGDLGHFEEAFSLFETAIPLMPDAIILRLGLGYLQLKRRDLAAARAEFQHVREAAPERYDAMVALARVQSLAGEHAEAADLYRRALAMRPDDASTRLDLGRCMLEMGERAAGEEALRAAVRAEPRLAAAALTALAAAPHGRLFLRPSAATSFLA